MFAIPAKRTPFTVYQKDSTAITVVLTGDETHHYLATLDGVPVVEDTLGFYRLAPELKEQHQVKWEAKSRLRNQHRTKRKAAAKAKARRAPNAASNLYAGDKKGIVILVEFSNLKMKTSDAQTEFSQMFNQEGYSQNGHIGSVHDYFYDQSYGQFNLTFDVYGPIQMNKSYSYYGANNSDDEDMHVGELARDACIRATSAYSIDWSKYDWDNDGEVDQVYLIYAGYSESSGAPSYTIWPHEWMLSEADGAGKVAFNGVVVDTYAMSNELAGTSGTTMEGIGTACHEFSHCLGLPDFYDTEGQNFGMNAWDIMDSGCYNGPNGLSERPIGFTAYERWYTGWLEPIELTDPCTIQNMPSLQQEPVAYVIYNDNHPDEFFLLENIQSEGWFAYISYYTNIHGMRVLHVNYNLMKWLSNTVNVDTRAQCMTIIPAGKTYGTMYASYYIPTSSQFQSQLFPGNKDVTTLDNTSHTSYGGRLLNTNTDGSRYMNKPLTAIKETNGLISFDFMGGASTDISALNAGTDGTIDSEITYFTLNGTQVKRPTKPGLYIVRRHGEVSKIYLP